MSFNRVLRLPVLLVVALACADGTGPIPLATPDALAFISDGAHGGTVGFYFLPPLARNPSATGDFDPGLSPVVDILCVSAGCPATEHASLNAVQVDEHYQALWNSRETGAVAGETYRVQVRVGEVVLGYAELPAARNAKGGAGAKPLLVTGQTLAVRFRVETGIAAQLIVEPEAATIEVGETQGFTATWLDLHGSATIGPPVSWASSDETVATVDASGVATGHAAGVTSIEASAGLQAASAALEVEEAAAASTPLTPGDVEAVASVGGWSVRCLEWSGSTCVRPQARVDCTTCGSYGECGEWHDLTDWNNNGLGQNRTARHFCLIGTGTDAVSSVGAGATPAGPRGCGVSSTEHPVCSADRASVHLPETGLGANHGLVLDDGMCSSSGVRLTVTCSGW